MESIRLLIRRMEKGDEAAFVSGIADRALRIAYGFPEEMDDTVSARIFERFSGLEGGYSLIEKGSGEMIGFLLDTGIRLSTISITRSTALRLSCISSRVFFM